MAALTRAGINAVFLRPRMGGLETYVRRIVPEFLRLRPDVRFSLFLNPEGREYLSDDDWFDDVDVVTHALLGRRWLTALSEVTVLGELARRRRLDVLHSVAMTGPLVVQSAHVAMVGDLIWLHDPESTGRLTAGLWKALVPQVARRAERVLTFSEATRLDLAEQFGLSTGKIDVVPLGYGVDEDAEPTPQQELRRRFDLGHGPVILSVSAKRTHKNLHRLVSAMAQVRERVPDTVLVLPGNPTSHEQELKSHAGALGLGEAVRFLEYVDRGDLEGLYRLSSAVVVPSLREGFGLPILEGMRRGVPVACSNVSSLPEVGGDAVSYFDPLDPNAMAEAVIRLITDDDLARQRIAAGLDRARTFTWERTAEGTLDSYERALRDRR